MPASVNFRPTRIPTVVTDALLNCGMFSATTTHEIPAASAAHQQPVVSRTFVGTAPSTAESRDVVLRRVRP